MKKFIIALLVVVGFVATSVGGSLLADPGDDIKPFSTVHLADPGDDIKP